MALFKKKDQSSQPEKDVAGTVEKPRMKKRPTPVNNIVGTGVPSFREDDRPYDSGDWHEGESIEENCRRLEEAHHSDTVSSGTASAPGESGKDQPPPKKNKLFSKKTPTEEIRTESEANDNPPPALVASGPEKRPLIRHKSAPTPFPIDSLSGFLVQAILTLAAITQAPIALCAQCLLGAISLAAQGLRDVVVDGRRHPTTIFLLTVAVSGERKSSVDRIAYGPIRELESELMRAYKEAMCAYEIDRGIYNHQFRKAMSSRNPHAEIESLGPPPVEPQMPLFITSDITIEGVNRFLEKGRPSIGIISDEAGRLVGGPAFASDNMLKTAAALSSFWDGTSNKSLRGMNGFHDVTGKRVALAIQIQPGPHAV